MIKVGVLLDSLSARKYLYETVKELAGKKNIELFFLLNKVEKKEEQNSKNSISKINSYFFTYMVKIESRIICLFSKDYCKKIKDHSSAYNIESLCGNEILYLSPLFSKSGLAVTYSNEDIKSIKNLNLDLMIRGNASGIFKGDILHTSQKGIISFHHGDNTWNRGGPPAFWEVYLKKISTGFIIQVLTEDLDAGGVIYRGNISTRPTYIQNLVSLYSESNPCLAKIITNYANTNHFPTFEQKIPFGSSLFVMPSWIQIIKYVMNNIIKASRFFLRRPGKKSSVKFLNSTWEKATLRKAIEMDPPNKRTFSNPFVITRNNKSICFVEDYSDFNKKTSISAVEIKGKNYKILSSVIDESSSVSSPCIFEFENQLYMTVNVLNSNVIKLYKSIHFPLVWKFENDIVLNKTLANVSIIKNENHWCLFGTLNVSDGIEHASKLMLYHTQNPLSNEWLEHERNPVVFDIQKVRHSGFLHHNENCIIRYSQNKSSTSQKLVNLYQVNKLTPFEFKEGNIGTIFCEYFSNNGEYKNFHSNAYYTVFESQRK